jgi:hypothetical protein
MTTPVLVAQPDLETKLTAHKLRQLLGVKGDAAIPADRIQMILDEGHGFVFGEIQRAVQISSVYALWLTRWTSAERAEIRRLIIGACVYYAHFNGQMGEEVPDSVVAELDKIQDRCQRIGDHVATVAAEPMPASSTQHDFIYGSGPGRHQVGSPRGRWAGILN